MEPEKCSDHDMGRREGSEVVRPEHRHYDVVYDRIRSAISCGEDMLFDPVLFQKTLHGLWSTYGIPYESVHSFFRNVHLEHIKRSTYRLRASMPRLLNEYKSGWTILDISKKANFSPHLLARYLVDELAALPKKKLADAMRDPVGILGSIEVIDEAYRATEQVRSEGRGNVTRLAMEVIEAQNADPLYGPRHDRKRHMIGVEYEVVLEHSLREIGVPFETESDLRGRGTARTPDVLFSVPLAIKMERKDGNGKEWKMICWVDSKALFGDVATHHSSVLPQAEAYVHRFGPGLVLYWFGHAPLERLADASGQIVIAGWNTPSEFILPTGEILKKERAGELSDCTER